MGPGIVWPMAHETATLFFALLAAALTLLLAVVLVSLVADRSGRLGLLPALVPASLELAAIVAATCTLGSLYLSEIAGFIPCRLCWVQRGFMYPAAVVLLVALGVRRARPSLSRKLAGSAAVLAVLGLPVSIFHRVEQARGEVGGFCSIDNPCSLRWVDHFGFVTIPTMAAAGFAGVFILVGLHLFWRAP
jgi:disulfide bond formation protein DsbB